MRTCCWLDGAGLRAHEYLAFVTTYYSLAGHVALTCIHLQSFYSQLGGNDLAGWRISRRSALQGCLRRQSWHCVLARGCMKHQPWHCAFARVLHMVARSVTTPAPCEHRGAYLGVHVICDCMRCYIAGDVATSALQQVFQATLSWVLNSSSGAYDVQCLPFSPGQVAFPVSRGQSVGLQLR